MFAEILKSDPYLVQKHGVKGMKRGVRHIKPTIPKQTSNTPHQSSAADEDNFHLPSTKGLYAHDKRRLSSLSDSMNAVNAYTKARGYAPLKFDAPEHFQFPNRFSSNTSTSGDDGDAFEKHMLSNGYKKIKDTNWQDGSQNNVHDRTYSNGKGASVKSSVSTILSQYDPDERSRVGYKPKYQHDVRVVAE